MRFQEVVASKFLDYRHVKVVKLSALRTDRLYSSGSIPGTHFCWSLSRPRAIMRPEGLCQRKITTTRSGIGPVTFWQPTALMCV